MADCKDDLNKGMPHHPWDPWRQDRPALRWIAMAAAAFSAAIAFWACLRPIVSQQIGPLRITIQNPLKGLLVAVVALHIWALLSPRIHTALERRWRISSWRLMLLIGAVESGAIAAIGVMATDLCWKCADILTWLNPLYASSLSFLLIALASIQEDPRPRLRAVFRRGITQWKNWNWGARLVSLALIVQTVMMGKSLVEYWKHTSPLFLRDLGAQRTVPGANDTILPSFNYFCDRCRKEIPADARILYHGPNQGLILAYELYPRRLFMLPAEQRLMFQDCWRNELWCRGMDPDPIFQTWKWDPPLPNISEQQFVAQHQIDYVVAFDEDHVSNCHIKKLR